MFYGEISIRIKEIELHEVIVVGGLVTDTLLVVTAETAADEEQYLHLQSVVLTYASVRRTNQVTSLRVASACVNVADDVRSVAAAIFDVNQFREVIIIQNCTAGVFLVGVKRSVI